MRKINCKSGSCTLAPMQPEIQSGGGGLQVRSVQYLVPLTKTQQSTVTKQKDIKQVGKGKKNISTQSRVSTTKPCKNTSAKKT
jgi:hypothetical protein